MAATSPRTLRVFIGCPGDMAPERAELLKLRDHFDELGCPVRFLIWKNATPGVGDAQKVIFDNYPVADWDIFIGLLWTRFGVPSGIKDSLSGETLTGTESEFAGAYDACVASEGMRPQVLLYRCTRDLPVDVDLEQIAGVRKFFKQTETGELRPALTQDFKTAEELARRVVQDIVKVAERLREVEKAAANFPTEAPVSVKKAIDWAGAEERYRRHLIDSHRIVKFHTAEARAPVEVELEKVFIKLLAAPAHGHLDLLVEDSLKALRGLPETKNPDGSPTVPALFARISRMKEAKAGLRLHAAEVGADEASATAVEQTLQARYMSGERPMATASGPATIADLLRQHLHLALAGSPGSGKTTLLQFLVLTFASRQQQARLSLDEERLPVLVRLRQFYRWVEQERAARRLHELEPAHFHQFLEQAWQRESGAPELPPGFFQRLLSGGLEGIAPSMPRRGGSGPACGTDGAVPSSAPPLILLDGLDEIAETAQRKKIAELVATALAGWRDARVILTSRPRAWEQEGRAALAGRVGEARLCDLDDAQIEEFVRHWYLAATLGTRGDTPSARGHAETRAADLIGALRPERIRRLAATPLMLSILAMVHSRGVGLPQERSQLYHECIEFMLGYWDEIQGLDHDPELHEVARLDRQTKRQLLEPVALWMHRLGSQQIEPRHDDLLQQFAAGFQSVLNEPRPAAERHARAFLRLIVERGGLMQESEAAQFRFVHLTFQEYLAASALAHGEAPFAQVERHLHDPWWREVILLAGGELSRMRSWRVKMETTAWLEGIRDAKTWAEPWLLRDLQLAIQSCAEMIETGVEPGVTRDLASRLIAAFAAGKEYAVVAPLDDFIRQLGTGHVTRALAAQLPAAFARGKGADRSALFDICWLLPVGVVDAPLLAAFAEARESEDADWAWQGAGLHLLHGRAEDRLAALARLRAVETEARWLFFDPAGQTFVGLGDAALTAAICAGWRDAMGGPDEDVAAESASLLLQHGGAEDREAALAWLADAAQQDGSGKQGPAFNAFARLGPKVDVPPVISALEAVISHPRSVWRGWAVRAWAIIVGPRAASADLTAIRAIAADPSSRAGGEAAKVLLKHGDEAAREALRTEIHDRARTAKPHEVLDLAYILLDADLEPDRAAIAGQLARIAGRLDSGDIWRLGRFAVRLGETAWSHPEIIRVLVAEAQKRTDDAAFSVEALAKLLVVRPAEATISCPTVAELGDRASSLAAQPPKSVPASFILDALAALSTFPELRVAVGGGAGMAARKPVKARPAGRKR